VQNFCEGKPGSGGTVSASTQPLGGHILYNDDTQLDVAEVAWTFFKKFWK
jgi:hypothetical protein